MDALLALGLNDQEVKAYTAILRLGDVPVSDVIKALKEHPQIVYRLIERLAAKGLVITSTKKHRKYVRAEDPRILQQMEERKLEQLRGAVPELLALQKAPKDALVRVAHGVDAVKSLRMRGIDETSPGGTYYIIGASGDRFYQIMGDYYLKVERKREKKKIKRKLLSFESQRALLKRSEPPTKYVEHRFLPSPHPVPSSTNIFNDTVAIFIWTEEPIVIAIESKEVAASYRHYFDSLWKVAKE